MNPHQLKPNTNATSRVAFVFGVSGKIRSSGVWSRSPTLHPAELQAQVFGCHFRAYDQWIRGLTVLLTQSIVNSIKRPLSGMTCELTIGNSRNLLRFDAIARAHLRQEWYYIVRSQPRIVMPLIHIWNLMMYVQWPLYHVYVVFL
jgi:hypothetical protein